MTHTTADDASAPMAQNPMQGYFTGGSVAWLAGINDYQALPPLKSTHNDCNGLKEVLEKKHGFTVNLLLDPGKTSFLAMLGRMKESCVADSRVIFYFAGHGVADGTDGQDTPKGFLLPADAERGKFDTYIDMAIVMEALSALPCRHLLIILDCCYAGAFRFAERTRSIGAEVPKTLYLQKFEYYVNEPARQVITSAASDQKAMDALGDRGNLNTNNRSPFAESLIQTLQQGDADISFGDSKPDGIMTGSELGFYLTAEVSDRLSKNAIPLADQQTPSIFRLGNRSKGEFVFIHSADAIAGLKNIVDRNPYKGLDDYSAKESSLFYGRQRVLDGWWEGKIGYKGLRGLLDETDPAQKKYRIVITGRSGSGKSSLVKVGVLAALPPASVHTIVPGSTPFTTHANLLQTISAAASLQYLLVDQYEELVTVCRDADERHKFEAALANIANDKKAVIFITIRSDIERRFTDSAFIGTASVGSFYRFVVPPFTRSEIREVVMQPAAQQMLEFRSVKGTDTANEEFVNRIIDEAFANPDSLPLLSFALSRLYDNRDGIYLKEEEYDNFGGISGILDNKFTECFNSYAPGTLAPMVPGQAEQDIFKQLVIRMISFDAGALAKRRVYTSYSSGSKTVSELEFTSDHISKNILAIKDRLVESRLLKTATEKDETLKPGANDNAYVEPAHEALLRSSNLLSKWQSESAPSGINFQQKVLLLRSLSSIAQSYFFEENRSDKKGLLWKDDPRLSYINKLTSSNELLLNKIETTFVKNSLAAKLRAKRVGAVVMMLVFLSMVTAAGIFLVKNQQLKRESENTQTERARSFGLNALSSMQEKDHVKSLLLLARALELNKDANADSLLKEQFNFISAPPYLSGVLQSASTILSFVTSANDKMLLAITDSAAEVWDLTNRKKMFSIPGFVNAAEFNAAATNIYVATDDFVQCWNIARGQMINSRKLINTDSLGNYAQMVLAANRILINEQDRTLLIDSNFKTITTLEEIWGHLSANGQVLETVAITNTTEAMHFWNVKAGVPKLLYTTKLATTPGDIKFSPSGRYAVVSPVDSGTVCIYDLQKTSPLNIGFHDYISVLEFTPDEKSLVLASDLLSQNETYTINLGSKKIREFLNSDRTAEPEIVNNFRHVSFFPVFYEDYGDSVLVNLDNGATALFNYQTGELGSEFNQENTYYTRSFFDSFHHVIVSLSENGCLRFHSLDGTPAGGTFYLNDSMNIANVSMTAGHDQLLVASGKLLYIYKFNYNTGGSPLSYASIFFVPESRLIVNLDYNNQIAICDTLNRALYPPTRLSAAAEPGLINRVVMAPDGKQAAIEMQGDSVFLVHFDKQQASFVSLCDSSARAANHRYSTYQKVPPAFVFTSNGSSLLLLGNDRKFHSIDTRTGANKTLCALPEDIEESVTLRADGKRFLAKAGNDSISEYAIIETAGTLAIRLKALEDGTLATASYLDQDRIVISGISRLQILNITTGKIENNFTAFHADRKRLGRVIVSDDKRKIIVVNNEQFVSVLDVKTGGINFSNKLPGLEYADDYLLVLGNDNRSLAAAYDSTIYFVDIASGKLISKEWDPLVSGLAFYRYNLMIADSETVEIRGTDLDIPASLFQLQAAALTGCRLNEFNVQEYIPEDQLTQLLTDYEREGEAHYKTCKYQQFNRWKKWHDDLH